MLNEMTVFLGTKVASTPVFSAVIGLIAVHTIALRQLWVGVAFVIATACMGLSVTLLKQHFAIARPTDALVPITGYAFPSGHGAGVTFFSCLVYTYCFHVLELPAGSRAPIISLLVTFTILICYSRIFFQVHTPIQVLAGALIGLAFGTGLYLLVTRVLL